MPEDNDGSEAEREIRLSQQAARLAAYDRKIEIAIATSEWLGLLSIVAAERDPKPFRGLLSTAWVKASRPRPELVDSLARIRRGFGQSGSLSLILESPTFATSHVQHRWCATVASSLNHLLGDEATFFAMMQMS